MGEVNQFHRPLMGGIKIVSAELVQGSLVVKGGGTLTGLATRHLDNRQVLVTNLHVMTGLNNIFVVSGDEEMYQELAHSANRVGDAFVPASVSPHGNNAADVAMCELLDNVLADFGVHSESHGIRHVIAGMEEPMAGDKLLVVGSTGGEGIVTVRATDRTFAGRGYDFTGQVLLDARQRPLMRGDSGAPCLVEQSPGRYRLCCIVTFGGGNSGYATPATVAERELGITFGYQSKITTRSEENMGIPILTSEGFAGQR